MKIEMPSITPKLQSAAFIIFTIFAAFVGFHLLYSARISEYSKEFVAGCTGALITIFATAVLLRTQTKSEILRSQASATFERKLDTYYLFVDHLNKITADGNITRKEFDSTVDWGVKLSIFCRPYTLDSIRNYLFQVLAYGAMEFTDLQDEDLENWCAWQSTQLDEVLSPETDNLDIHFTSYGQLIHRLREDLLELDATEFEDHFQVMEQINHIRNMRGATSAHFDLSTSAITYSYE